MTKAGKLAVISPWILKIIRVILERCGHTLCTDQIGNECFCFIIIALCVDAPASSPSAAHKVHSGLLDAILTPSLICRTLGCVPSL